MPRFYEAQTLDHIFNQLNQGLHSYTQFVNIPFSSLLLLDQGLVYKAFSSVQILIQNVVHIRATCPAHHIFLDFLGAHVGLFGEERDIFYLQ
jgi:hypothetical protein